MKALFSPGSVVTVVGFSLATFGLVAYLTDYPTLNLIGFFYGIPVLLGGLALKSSELPPASWLQPPSAESENLRQKAATPIQRQLVRDVRRWRYGQKVHLQSSLETLKLFHEEAPPQIEGLMEENEQGRYRLTLRLRPGAEGCSAWHDQQERLGRFFGPGVSAEVVDTEDGCLDLRLVSC